MFGVNTPLVSSYGIINQPNHPIVGLSVTTKILARIDRRFFVKPSMTWDQADNLRVTKIAW